MRSLHQYWKLLVVLFVMLVQVLIGYAAALFLRGPALRRFRIAVMRKNSRVILAVLGVELNTEGLENFRSGQAYMVVSNHLSYVDTLLFANAMPVVLVSTMEIRRTPFLGQVVNASGCLFVERRSRERLREEIKEMTETLKEGFSLAFFPEGTSTNGSSVLEFKSSLFAPAQRAEVPVLPVVVQLEKVDGQPVSAANRDLFCYHSDMVFHSHLLALAGADHTKVTLKILPSIRSASREELASLSHSAIVANYRPTS
jgi:1-acyl-sn-glycerol-3-phosphate acyltransferase